VLLGADTGEGAQKVSLHLGVLARGETTKKGASQGVEILDLALRTFYQLRKREVGDSGKIFAFSLDKYRKNFNDVLTLKRMADLGSVHLLRHSAAIYYKHYEEKSDQWIQERGRWGAHESVLHYQKKHLLIRNEGRVSPEDLKRGDWLWEDPNRFGLKLPLPSVDEVAQTDSAYPSLLTLELSPPSVSTTSFKPQTTEVSTNTDEQ
jgi:hypothetical protein